MFVWIGDVLVNADDIVALAFKGYINEEVDIHTRGGCAFRSCSADRSEVAAALAAVGLIAETEDHAPCAATVTRDQWDELSEAYDLGYEWVAMDSVGMVRAYREEPKKDDAYWLSGGACRRLPPLDDAPCLRWEDEKATLITELLEVE